MSVLTNWLSLLPLLPQSANPANLFAALGAEQPLGIATTAVTVTEPAPIDAQKTKYGRDDIELSDCGNDKLIRVSFETSIHLPSLKLRITRPTGGFVHYHIFANCIKPRKQDGNKLGRFRMRAYVDEMSPADKGDFSTKVEVARI